jgi:hypothetical protein
MRILAATVLVSGAFVAGLVSAQDSETEVKLQDLPPAVAQTVKAQSQGATLRGLSKEVKGGATLYEAELLVRGRTKDVLLDAQGKVVSVEEQTTLDEIPASSRAAIQKAVGTGKLVLVEKVTKGETTFYEGHISNGRKALEVKVDADGKAVE